MNYNFWNVEAAKSAVAVCKAIWILCGTSALLFYFKLYNVMGTLPQLV